MAARYDTPVALYELGASAGLNLMLDRYRYRLGETEAGDSAAALFLQPQWEGASPPTSTVSVIRRRGVDLHPIDITRAEDRERLSAYVWPDQSMRVANLSAAIAIALADRPHIDRADAADWVEANLSLDPEPGVARVITHTIAAQYFPADVRRRIEAHILRAGAAATHASPVAWLRYEIDPAHNNLPTLSLAVWPTGEDKILAYGHPHGTRIKWVA